MKILLCTAALALFVVTTMPAQEGMFKYSFDREVGNPAKQCTIVIESVSPMTQDTLEKLWVEEWEPLIIKNNAK